MTKTANTKKALPVTAFKRAVCLMLAIFLAISSSAIAFATGSDTSGDLDTVFGRVETVGKDLLGKIQNIVLTVGAVSLAICGLMFLFGGQRTAEQAKAWAFRICLGVVIIMCAKLIIQTIKNMVTL